MQTTQHNEIVKYKLSPIEYQNILRDIELVSVNLVFLKYNLKTSNKSTGISLSINTSSKLGQSENDIITILFDFSLTGKQNARNILNIAGQYSVLYKSSIEITDDFLAIFNDYTLKAQMWPYLRELFMDITVRSNMPPLVLPLIKFMAPAP
jgi:preprotein translocase subunit SecB